MLLIIHGSAFTYLDFLDCCALLAKTERDNFHIFLNFLESKQALFPKPASIENLYHAARLFGNKSIHIAKNIQEFNYLLKLFVVIYSETFNAPPYTLSFCQIPNGCL